MNSDLIKGYVHSFQSLGAVDGPGIRYVVFLQGCPLRCGCCHNPDTWDIGASQQYTASQVVEKVLHYKSYFGDKGGVTVTGGEPLIQPLFTSEIFRLCHENGVNTCLDTSGCVLNNDVKTLLNHTDRVLLDVKYTDDVLYKKHVGCDYKKVLKFLEYLNQKNIPTTLRQVIIPSLNDNQNNLSRLNELAKTYPCVDKIELLPFKKVCQVKYDDLKIDFPFKDIPTPDEKLMQELSSILEK